MKENHALEKGYKFVGILKIISVLAVIGGIIFLVVMVVNNSINKRKNERIINNVINDSLTALKNLDKENVNRYLNYNKLISGLDEIIVKEENTEFEKELFEAISWEIDSYDIRNDEAIVIIKVTNKNFKNILTKWVKCLILDVKNEEKIVDDIALEKLEDIVKNEEDTKTEIKKITLKKQNNNWTIEVNDNLIDLIYPGIYSVTKILK